MTNQSILLTIQGGVARVTLNRPEKMNSFTQASHQALRDTLDTVERDSSVRVLLLTGSGRAFCAGQDLADEQVAFVPGQTPPDMGVVVEENYKPLILRLQNLPIPTVAAVNGVAAGAGSSIALACDLVIAKESASFIQAFSKIGLIPDTGGTWFLPQRVGMARAMGMALLGDKIPATTAAQWGLIWSAVADEAFDQAVDSLTQKLALAPTKALVRTRQAMFAAHRNSLEEQLTLEANMMRELGQSDDFIEGVAAFLEKRPAVFKGK